MLLIMAVASGGVVAQTPSSTPLRRVLVLYSDERLVPFNIILDEAIRATFAADTSHRIKFHSEFLDVTRFPGESMQTTQTAAGLLLRRTLRCATGTPSCWSDLLVAGIVVCIANEW